jgi:hypothetical protein
MNESIDMTLEYTVTFAGEIKKIDRLKCLSSIPDFKEDNGELIAQDLQIFIKKPSELYSLVIEDEFSFIPSITISFRLNKFAELVLIRKRMIRAVSSLLQHTLEDMVFLFNDEVLMKKT